MLVVQRAPSKQHLLNANVPDPDAESEESTESAPAGGSEAAAEGEPLPAAALGSEEPAGGVEAVTEWEGDDDFEWPEYIGETRERKPWLAVLMTLMSPGLGYVYLGRFATGMAVNIAFLASLSGFIILWTVLKFFPLPPLLVLMGGWTLLESLLVHDLLGRIRRQRPYVLRPTNHLIVYSAVLIFTFLVPTYLTIDWSLRYVWQRTWAGSDAMAPTTVAGDLILVDRTAFMRRSPGRGELVLIDEPESNFVSAGMYFARVVAVGGDRVHMEGNLPWVNGVQLEQRVHAETEALTKALGEPRRVSESESVPVVEAPYGVKVKGEGEPKYWYLINLPTRPVIEPTEPVSLADRELFVLSDNRTVSFADPNTRQGGRVIQREWVVGKPLFVLFSVAADGEYRWDRVGIRLR